MEFLSQRLSENHVVSFLVPHETQPRVRELKRMDPHRWCRKAPRHGIRATQETAERSGSNQDQVAHRASRAVSPPRRKLRRGGVASVARSSFLFLRVAGFSFYLFCLLFD